MTIKQQIDYAATEVAKLENVLREAHEGLQHAVECEKEADELRVGVAKMLVYATKASRCIATLGRTFGWYEARRNDGKEDAGEGDGYSRRRTHGDMRMVRLQRYTKN